MELVELLGLSFHDPSYNGWDIDNSNAHDTGSGDLELVELLTCLGLSIADQSRNGWDVFMWACLGGHAAVVTNLVGLGSNIGVKDREDRLGLHWAAEKGHADAVGVLVRDMLQANLDIQATVRLSCL